MNHLVREMTPVSPLRHLRMTVGGLLDAAARRRQRRRARRRLASLSNGALRDLGIDRSEIMSVLDDAGGERRRGVRVTTR